MADFIVNDRQWNIVFVNPHSNALMRSDGSYTVGCTDNNTSNIFLADNLQGDFLLKVLTHEVCHVFCFSYNIVMPLEQEEQLCDFVATFGRNIIALTDAIFKNIM